MGRVASLCPGEAQGEASLCPWGGQPRGVGAVGRGGEAQCGWTLLVWVAPWRGREWRA